MKTRRIFSILADMAAIWLFIYLLIFPQYAAEPTRHALEFCAATLIPSLFIYMVLAKTVISLPITDRLTRFMGLEGFALITGTLCGCPVGAKNALTLYEQGKITKKHAEYLCSFTNNASLSFVVGFVGGELFGDISVGVKLLIFQLLSSAVTAVIMKYMIFGKEKIPNVISKGEKKIGLREAITDSASTIITVCACAVFFIVAGDAVSRVGNFSPFADGILKSVLEFSSGCAAASKLGESALPVTAFAIGQTGLSVAMQVKSVIGNKLSIRPFLVGKAVSCIIMTVLAYIAR